MPTSVVSASMHIENAEDVGAYVATNGKIVVNFADNATFTFLGALHLTREAAESLWSQLGNVLGKAQAVDSPRSA